jgi:predicted signal transduction protein with EAL and GGDEF domain
VVLADRDHYHKAEELLRDADHAMYCTKQQGRQGYTVFNHQLRINQADQLALESRCGGRWKWKTSYSLISSPSSMHRW